MVLGSRCRLLSLRWQCRRLGWCAAFGLACALFQCIDFRKVFYNSLLNENTELLSVAKKKNHIFKHIDVFGINEHNYFLKRSISNTAFYILAEKNHGFYKFLY